MKITITWEMPDEEILKIAYEYLEEEMPPEVVERALQQASEDADAQMATMWGPGTEAQLSLIVGAGLGLAARFYFPDDPDARMEWAMERFAQRMGL